MIKKLRRQFILIATIAILIILTALIGVTIASTYGIVNLFVSHTLDEFREAGKDKENFITQQLLGPLDNYDVFYYEMKIDSDYNVISYDDSHNPQTLTESSAQSLADKAETTQKNNRFHYNSRYYAWILNESRDMDNTLVIIDYTMVMNWVGQISHVSLLVGIIGFLLFEFLVIMLSGKAIQPALENAENQRRFITNASHELKTPVAVISADNEVIEALHGKDEWTDSISNQVTRLNSLITSLVQLVKSGEREKAELTDTDISSVVKESIHNYSPLMEKRKLSLVTDIEPDVHVKTDPSAISEITGILLDNAAKYCDEEGTVKAEVHKSTIHVNIIVSNDYKDGKDTDYDKFFERFYREDQSHNSAVKGFGIGLSIAEELTRSVKGKIHAEWKDGRIYFIITL